VVELDEPSTVIISNTIIVSQTVGITVTAGNTAVLEGMLWGSGIWANGVDWVGEGTVNEGAINIREDPGFVDPLNDDYHLAAGSAAIDAGIDAGVLFDIDGDPRPVGPRPDIGADEYPSPLSPVYMPLILRASSGSGSSQARYLPWPANE
jgi:hypothetical protein